MSAYAMSDGAFRIGVNSPPNCAVLKYRYDLRAVRGDDINAILPASVGKTGSADYHRE